MEIFQQFLEVLRSESSYDQLLLTHPTPKIFLELNWTHTITLAVSHSPSFQCWSPQTWTGLHSEIGDKEISFFFWKKGVNTGPGHSCDLEESSWGTVD